MPHTVYSIVCCAHPSWIYIARPRLTGNCISRRNREEIPGNFGRRSCAVCNVAWAQASTPAPTTPQPRPATVPVATPIPTPTPACHPRARASVSALRILWRRFIRRGRSFQFLDTGQGYPAGTLLSGSEPDPLAGDRSGGWPILRNVSSRWACRRHFLRALLSVRTSTHDLRCGDAESTTFCLSAQFSPAASMNAGRHLASSCMDTRAHAAWQVPRGKPSRKSAPAGRSWPAHGLDRKINPRFALRFKADYLQTGTSFSIPGKQKQDNFRFSVGVCHPQCAQKEAHTRGGNSNPTVTVGASPFSQMAGLPTTFKRA